MARLNVEGRVGLAALDAYWPARVVTNRDLIAEFGLPVTESWIRGRIGVEERRWADADQAASDLAFEAACRILDRAGIRPHELDRLIVSTTSGDWIMPSTACAVQDRLEPGCTYPAYDVSAACSGFLYAMEAASRALMTGEERVLVVASEIRSRQINPREGRILPIYGDAAGGGLFVSREPSRTAGLQAMVLYADGAGTRNVTIPGGGSRLPLNPERLASGRQYLEMKDGREIFERATETMVRCAQEVMEMAGWRVEDVAYLVPHQANLGMIRAIRDELGVSPERCAEFIQRTGNCSSATIPLSLKLASEAGRIKKGDRLVLTAAGGGYTAGAVALVW